MSDASNAAESYRGYRNLPTLAGLAPMRDAARPGLAVEESVRRLKRIHHVLKRLHGILTARIPSEPIYELKMAFSYHAYLCAEHVAALRTRVAEMREPPLHLDVVPDAGLQLLLDEVASAGSTAELLVGVYEVALPGARDAAQRYLDAAHVLADQPSRRLLRFAAMEIEEMLAFGREAAASLVDEPSRRAMADWRRALEDALASAGGVDGALPRGAARPEAMRSAAPPPFDAVPRRDERFQDLFNQSVNPEAFLHDPEMPARPKTLMLLFKRLREIDVPEMMASIIVQTPDKPWEYYRDMSRQLWDEARHAMMGELGFAAMGIDWTAARITHNWSLRLNTECTPLERHAVLWFIEQGLMGKDGKRFEWEVGRDADEPLVAMFQDFDWADEVLHARIGRHWLVRAIGDRSKALAFGDAAWSRVLSRWGDVKAEGLTRHENWWPALYREACRAWGVEPDPRVLEFSVSYDGRRADLQSVSG